jgi:hypothetical protein
MTSKTTSIFTPEAIGITGPLEIEPPASTPKTSDTKLRAKKQIKLRKLLEFLQSAAEKDPEILELPVFTVEFGGLERVTEVDIDIVEGRIVISS